MYHICYHLRDKYVTAYMYGNYVRHIATYVDMSEKICTCHIYAPTCVVNCYLCVMYVTCVAHICFILPDDEFDLLLLIAKKSFFFKIYNKYKSHEFYQTTLMQYC